MEFIEYNQSGSALGNDQLLNLSFDWVFWILMLFNLIAFAFVRTLQSGYITVLFRTGVYNRQLYQNMQEDLRLRSAGSVLLTLACFNSLAILASSFVTNTNSQFVWFMLGIICVVILLKYVAIKALSFLTETVEGLTEHWSNHLIYFQILSLVLTPVLCLTHFMSPETQDLVAKLLTLFVFIILLVREFQSLIRAVRQRLSIVYIILYLCTLELIPLIVLIRVLVR